MCIRDKLQHVPLRKSSRTIVVMDPSEILIGEGAKTSMTPAAMLGCLVGNDTVAKVRNVPCPPRHMVCVVMHIRTSACTHAHARARTLRTYTHNCRLSW